VNTFLYLIFSMFSVYYTVTSISPTKCTCNQFTNYYYYILLPPTCFGPSVHHRGELARGKLYKTLAVTAFSSDSTH
jgi:hypothetical protein